jgi:hypothetical protein
MDSTKAYGTAAKSKSSRHRLLLRPMTRSEPSSRPRCNRLAVPRRLTNYPSIERIFKGERRCTGLRPVRRLVNCTRTAS